MTSSEIKKEARELLRGKWLKAVCITLVFLLFSSIAGFIQGFLDENSALYNIIDIIFLIVSVPLSFGLLISFMKLKRNEEVSVFTLFKEGFSRFGKSWGIWFHTFIRLLLPIICLILVAILMVSLGVVNFLTQSNLLLTLLGTILFIATILYVACRALLYVLAYYISFDNPELTSKECVLRSAELMKGNRGNYFVLEFSFIGWFLLIIISTSLGTILLSIILVSLLSILGSYIGALSSYLIMILGILFLMSYIQVATICFYEKIAKVEVKNTKTAKKVEE